jgi:hypothetical protein
MSAVPGPGSRAWFSALGAPLAATERAAIDAILAASDVPGGGAIVVVPDWAALAQSLRLLEQDDQWWNREEDEREALWDLAALGRTEGELAAEIESAVESARAAIDTALLAARPAACDPDLLAGARAAALLAVHQHALAKLAGAPAGHVFVRKHELFAAGRWPLGLVAGRFHVF